MISEKRKSALEKKNMPLLLD